MSSKILNSRHLTASNTPVYGVRVIAVRPKRASIQTPINVIRSMLQVPVCHGILSQPSMLAFDSTNDVLPPLNIDFEGLSNDIVFLP